MHSTNPSRRPPLGLAISAVLVVSSSLMAQVGIHRTLSSPPAMPSGNNRAGSDFASLGDVNGDGHDDYAMGSPSASIGIGRVRLISGAPGLPLWDFNGPFSARSFGFALARIPDVNADNVDDLGVGAPDSDSGAVDAGNVYILSGATGATLRTIEWTGPGDHFGFSLASIRLAGLADPYLVVGIPDRTFSRGGFNVYNAATGALYVSYTAPVNGDHAGFSLANAGDWNDDGNQDIVVGIPDRLNADGGIGEVRVISVVGAAISTLSIISGGTGTTQFGHSVDGGGDLNGDEFSDIIVGAPYYDSGAGTNNGRMVTITGPFGMTRHTLIGLSLARAGMDVSFIGDLDHDGFTDFAYGYPSSAVAGAPAGRVVLRSGHLNTAIGTITDPLAIVGFGTTVAAAGDPNRDGHLDVLIGNGPENIAVLAGVNPSFVGSREDLVLRTSNNASDFRSWPDVQVYNVGDVGESLRIDLVSPNSSYVGTFPFIIGYLRPTAAPNATLAGYPEVHLDPSAYFFLFDAGQMGIFGPAILPPSGVQVTGAVPAGLSGLSMMLQGAVLAPAPYLGNPAFTLTNAVEYRFL